MTSAVEEYDLEGRGSLTADEHQFRACGLFDLPNILSLKVVVETSVDDSGRSVGLDARNFAQRLRDVHGVSINPLEDMKLSILVG